MAFTHLHVHTEYSLLDGAARIGDIVRRARELGFEHLAITDHGAMYGAVDFFCACRDAGIKPILGCEVYVAPRAIDDREGRADKEYSHLVLLARNQAGYKNLMKLSSLGFIRGFYYKPRIDYNVLAEHAEGIIGLSACLAGDIPRLIMAGRKDDAAALALRLEGIFGKGNFYIEIQDHGIAEEREVAPKLISLAHETGIPLVVTNDVHYVERRDAEAQDALLCIQTNRYLEDENRMRFETPEFYLKSEKEMRRLFPHLPEAYDNAYDIASRCEVEMDFTSRHMPGYEVPEGYSHAEFLRERCFEGLVKHLGGRKDENYEKRLDYELEVIEQMGFSDYFLIVWDFINFANKNEIAVGPGRGSAAGSLAAYCLGITDIDPIKYNLLFERFLNPERISMPDIDIDFCFERRSEVIDYVVKKYGADHVAQIITFGTMAARAAIRDVGRVMKIPYGEVDRIAKTIPFEPGMTIERALKISPELRDGYEHDERIRRLVDIALKLEGLPRHASTHAAGVVISKMPLVEYVPLQKNDEAVTTQFPMGVLEKLGLLKMDFLGLRTLTVIRDALDLIYKNKGIKIRWEDMQMDDPEVYKMLGEGETDGVFQLESGGMRQFMRELQPECFEDIVAGISLYRPGPMDSIPRYIEGKRNPGSVKYVHEKLRPILEVTYGCIVYQEQVMQIVRDLAGYSLGRSDLVRRAMSKKKADVMERERKNFIYGDEELGIPGAAKNGVPESAANIIFDQMSDFAQYAFNKSHAAAYGVVAYRTAYLKRYYPVEFVTALINSYIGSSDKVAGYIQHARKTGIPVLPPDINKSDKKFSVENGAIRFGLLAIRNVGQGAIDAIIDERKKGYFKSFYDFISRVDTELLNKRMLESLIKSGCFDSMGVTRASLMACYEKAMDAVARDRKRNIAGQLSLFSAELDTGAEMPAFETPNLAEYPARTLLAMEKEMTGIYISGHPLEQYADVMETLRHNSQDILGAAEGTPGLKEGDAVEIGGIITSKRLKVSKSNSMMAYVDIEDTTGVVGLVVFPSVLQKYSALLEVDRAVVVRGRINVREDDANCVVVDTVQPLSEKRASAGSNKTLRINLPEKKMIADPRLLQALQKYPGGIAVVIDTGGKRYRPDGTRVCENEQLLRELGEIFGDGCAKYA